MTRIMPINEDTTTLDAFRARVVRHPDRIALEELEAGGARRDAKLTWRQWHELSTRVARALIRDGVQRGDAVAVLAGNRNLWPIAELGILMAGAVSVGLHGNEDLLARQLGDCHAVAAIVDSAVNLQRLMARRGELPDLRVVVCEDGASNGARWWGEWLDDSMAADTPLPDASLDDIALLAYGSADGDHRAARITHRCITASTASARETLGVGERDCAVSVTPYHDVEERILGLHLRVLCGIPVVHVADERTLWPVAGATEATLLIGRAVHYEALHEALLAHERTLGATARASWSSAIELGRERLALLRAGDSLPDAIEARWRVAMAPGRAARQRLGLALRVATARGTPLRRDVADHLAALGMTVRAGYGPVEHLCATMQPSDDYTPDDAGLPMPGTELRVGDDGELLIRRSALTFAGYHQRPAATRDSFTSDGLWLRTGRRGKLLPDGRLRLDEP